MASVNSHLHECCLRKKWNHVQKYQERNYSCKGILFIERHLKFSSWDKISSGFSISKARVNDHNSHCDKKLTQVFYFETSDFLILYYIFLLSCFSESWKMNYVLRLRYVVFCKGNMRKSRKKGWSFCHKYLCTMFISSPLDVVNLLGFRIE